MKSYLYKIQSKIKKKIEFILLLGLIAFSIIIVQIYNVNKNRINNNYIDLINNIYFQKSLSYVFKNLEPKYIHVEHKVSTGETFDKILKEYQIPKNEIKKIKDILKKKNNLNNIKINQIIKFTVDQSEGKLVTKLLFPVSHMKKVQLIRDLEKDVFEVKEIITDLNKKIVFEEGKIVSSLYKSAVKSNIPPNIIIEFARIYGFQVDFQRDIRKNDSFQIMYEAFENNKEKIVDTGIIMYANLKLRGQNNKLYFFPKKGSEGHYDINGRSVKKALMKTPINGARLSSSFGMRKHPIDGFNKMHRGTDFAAPEGTPIMASGDGIIIKKGWCGGGGNCIKIKHNSTYTTVYAHMSSFSSKVKKNKRVKQGQIIGYVGSTGKSTGPHLHYEVIMNGKKINSQKLKLPSGKILKKDDRKFFEIERIKIDVIKSEIILGLN